MTTAALSPPSLQAASVTAQVVVILGPARAGKTRELLTRYQHALGRGRSDGSGRVLWLAPSARSAAMIRDSLVAHGQRASLAPGITTFEELTKHIVAAANLKIRRISKVAERELIRRAVASIQQKKRFKFFAEAALRSGFIDLVAFHIRELRERDIRPAQYARIASASSRDKLRHQELAFLYTEYDRQLTMHGLCDAEGYHWAARDALANGCSRFENLELVVVDGFTDFTRTQHEMLRVLAHRTQQLLISLPAEKNPLGGRADLFAKTTATLAELKTFYPQLKENAFGPQPSVTPALDHISQHIFEHPQPPLPAAVLASTNSIEFIEAAGVQNEIVQLARHIKQRLAGFPVLHREGLGKGSPSPSARPVTPDDIVVVFRSIIEVAPRIEEVFGRFGIPYSLESAPRIASAPVFRTLTNLLQLDADDWPFRKLIAVITNNMLAAIDEPTRAASDWLVRDLQIASGREQLLAIAADLATLPIDSTEISPHRRRRIEAATSARPLFTKISDALANLPQQASPNEWVAAIENLGASLGIAALIPPADPNSRDAARAAISTHFAALERLSGWLKESPPIWSRQELLIRLIDIATKEALPRIHDDVGRVRILSAPTARAVPARHLYLAGMSEQAFPLNSRGSRLVNEGDYHFFTAAAHQTSATSPAEVASAPSRSQDEMLLFYEVISRAQESLTISYPAMDEKAQ
ncbi:MAG TPA: UvrD-helicase domain-containing protein, partial [Lacipirellulaceae bacterium]|nr:UvrD-helicase domain-containing protein [Lacipirellulaceae bacterium]